MNDTSTSPAVPPRREPYDTLIHRPANQLLLIVPLLLIFHIGSEWLGHRLLVPEYLRIILRWFGATGRYLSGLLIVAVLIAQHVTRKDPWRLSPLAAAGMVLESAVWTVPLLAVSWLTQRIAAQVGPASAAAEPFVQDILESIGAGVYEEFLFRLVLISLIGLLMIDLLGMPKKPVMIVAMILSAVTFAAVHFTTHQLTHPSQMSWNRFAFLTLAGLWWAVLYAWRGYGVAVCSHVWWDLFVVLMK
jgi:hypothetical protein